MSAVLAIIAKDLKIFFTRPLFYMLAGLCCILWSIFFTFGVVSFNQASFMFSAKSPNSGLNIHQKLIAEYVVIIHYLLLFIIATITMKFFAEEKKMKTFPLLLSSPVSSWQLVLAKWGGGAIVLLTLLLISALYPLSLTFFTDVPMVPLMTSYFGLFLILLVYVSVGLLASAMTDSLIVSVVLAIVFNLALQLLSLGKEYSDHYLWQEIFSFISFEQHFNIFRHGSLSLSSSFFFISLSFFFLFLSERVIEFHRWR